MCMSVLAGYGLVAAGRWIVTVLSFLLYGMVVYWLRLEGINSVVITCSSRWQQPSFFRSS